MCIFASPNIRTHLLKYQGACCVSYIQFSPHTLFWDILITLDNQHNIEDELSNVRDVYGIHNWCWTYPIFWVIRVLLINIPLLFQMQCNGSYSLVHYIWINNCSIIIVSSSVNILYVICKCICFMFVCYMYNIYIVHVLLNPNDTISNFNFRFIKQQGVS